MKARLTSTVAAVLLTSGGAGAVVHLPAAAQSPPQLAELWIDPGTAPRDLFWAPGGETLAPAAGAAYQFQARDEAGFSIGYDVTGPDEGVVRILWGIGYHQPPTSYLPTWTPVNKGAEPKTESGADAVHDSN